MDYLQALLATTVSASTPLLFAAAGELVAERTGVLNLGVEGMMIIGAAVGFAVGFETGSAAIGCLAAMLAGAVLAAVFGLMALGLAANQVASGLALTILGTGLSGLIGTAYVGQHRAPLPHLDLGPLSRIPVLGPVLFGEDALVYLSVTLIVALSLVLYRTRLGLVLRAVGDNPASAHGLGYPVRWIRFLAVLFGGACAGLGGAYLSLAYTPFWASGMTAGRGWIALALVVFASWRPGRLVLGAYLFGFISVAQLHLQAIRGELPAALELPGQFWSSLPYAATILVLVLISRSKARAGAAPASLGNAFVPDR